MQDSLNYDGLKKFFILSSAISQLNTIKAKSGSKAIVVDTGAEYMYEESSNQWYLQPSSGGGGITPAQLEAYVQDNTIKTVSETPSASDYSEGNVIFDKSDGQIKICATGQSGKSWMNITQVWLEVFKQITLDPLYATKEETIIKVSSLPTATAQQVGKYVLLTINNRVYKCENVGTEQTPVYLWVEKLTPPIEELNSPDVPQSLDNKSKFYLTKESVTRNNQTVTGYTGYKKTSTAEELGLIVDATGIHIPTFPLDLPWSVFTTESSWQTYILDNDYLDECELFEADCVCLTGTANNTWFADYIGNVTVALPKLLYEDENGVQTVGTLSSFEQILQNYQLKIIAGAGLVFDGNTLKHSNSVTPKPQRYIRATAYDAQGHAINFGVDYLVARSDYNDDAISDLHLTSSMWVHVHHSPIEASVIKPVNYSTTSIDDCVFNFPIVDNSKGNTYAEQVFFATITSPISNTSETGVCRTKQTKNGNGNFYFEQYFTKIQQANYDQRIEYFRKGSIRNQTSVTMDNIVDNKNLIQWQTWIPVEYPKTNLTLSNTTDFFVDSFCFSVSGGNVTIFISGLRKLVESPSSNTFATIPSCLKSANGSGGHSMLIDSNTFNTFATLSKIDPSDSLLLRGAVTTAKYYGILVYGL